MGQSPPGIFFFNIWTTIRCSRPVSSSVTALKNLASINKKQCSWMVWSHFQSQNMSEITAMHFATAWYSCLQRSIIKEKFQLHVVEYILSFIDKGSLTSNIQYNMPHLLVYFVCCLLNLMNIYAFVDDQTYLGRINVSVFKLTFRCKKLSCCLREKRLQKNSCKAVVTQITIYSIMIGCKTRGDIHKNIKISLAKYY